MNLQVLDTDHRSLYQYGQPAVVRRVTAVPADQLAITVITGEELLAGWFAQLRPARTSDKLTRAYAGLFNVAEMIRRIRVLPFPASAVQRCFALRKQFPRLGKLDLAIAAVVLDCNGILITRNRRDFAQLPGLQLEDWSLDSGEAPPEPGSPTRTR